jgi:hypothetical protein
MVVAQVLRTQLSVEMVDQVAVVAVTQTLQVVLQRQQDKVQTAETLRRTMAHLAQVAVAVNQRSVALEQTPLAAQVATVDHPQCQELQSLMLVAVVVEHLQSLAHQLVVQVVVVMVE